MSVPGPILLCVAAPAECERVLAAFGAAGPTTPGSRVQLSAGARGVELLATGVGPTAAGVSVAASLAHRSASAVVSLGIAGAYQASGVGVLDTVCSDRSVLAGEGRAESAGFTGLAAMGFGPFDGEDWAETSPDLVTRLAPSCKRVGPIATVSSVSGTDALAAQLHARTGAVAEAMEGAAVHLAGSRMGVPFVEVRVISNIAGDRERHPWKLAESLGLLGPLSRAVADALAE
ncbi:MAG: futalosine hydrolase [Planctomycetota bacterium]